MGIRSYRRFGIEWDTGHQKSSTRLFGSAVTELTGSSKYAKIISEDTRVFTPCTKSSTLILFIKKI